MIRVRPMTIADLPLGMRLKAQAGWNQTEADWRRFLWLQPDGCFVAELDDIPVGTTVCFIFGPVAWVAMVLVDQAVRGRGIGTALMRHALEFLDGRAVRSVRLDATPLGRPIYEKLGFAAQYTLRRYAGIPADLNEGPLLTAALRPDDWPDVVSLDRQLTGASREALLHRLQEEGADAFRVLRREGRFLGYLTWRPVADAVMVGPCLASCSTDGMDLLIDAFHRLAGRRIFVDVPEGNRLAVALLERSDLAFQRQLLRMTRGDPVHEDLELLWASSGPEKG
jgi:GNAT superfamily N-acetyltransferase